MTPALQLRSVTKRFGSFTAVRDLSLDVRPGEILGFLGPNGAGKSTSLRVALGIMPADEGEVSLLGGTPALERLHRVGFLPEERGLYRRMSPRAIISYFAQLKGMSGRDARKRAGDLLERAGLGEFASSKVSQLSKGMAQKVQILSTLVHEPDLLILDEPFSGLDPVNQADLEELIRGEHARGATIIFSTHVMEHAERLCDRLVVIARGQKRFDGTMDEALRLGDDAARITVPQGYDLAARLPEGWSATPHPSDPGRDAPVPWQVRSADGALPLEALKSAIEAGVPIMGFSEDRARLRDVFVSLVAEADQEADHA